MAQVPRVTEAEIGANGGTVSSFIADMVEVCRLAPMEEKERAVAALHAVAGQTKERAVLVRLRQRCFARATHAITDAPHTASVRESCVRGRSCSVHACFARTQRARAVHAYSIHFGSPPERQVGERAVKQFVSLANTGSHVAQTHAAAALAIVIASDEACAARASELGAIVPLAAILRGGTGAVQEQAAAAIAAISSATDDYDEAIIKAGVLPSLVGLLKAGGRAAAHVHATSALANVASSADAQQQIFKAGGVACLVSLLGGAVPPPAAARALARLAHENMSVQKELHRLGAISCLLALVSNINVETRIQGTAALSELCAGVGGKLRKKAQNAIAKSGGIGPLLGVLESPSSKQALVSQATHTVAMLARGHRENQDAIAAMNGLRTLVDQLQPSRTDGSKNVPLSQANAALAIGCICQHHPANQAIVADLGGVAQLCTLMRQGSATSFNGIVECEAAGALWALGDGNDANCASIASAGGLGANALPSARVVPNACAAAEGRG